MARIRSIHPGLFTDESFVSCSPLARLLVLGLWTEADDQGVFEWKPVTLKMRVLPVDGADVSALLTEIESQNIVKRFEHQGKAYGAIRNFRKYQRPKYPTAVHHLPDDLRSYVAIPPKAPVEDGRFPQKGEGDDQMEDGEERRGGDNKDTGKPASLAGQPEILDLEEAERLCLKASGRKGLGPFTPIRKILLRRKIAVSDVLDEILARTGEEIVSWNYFVPILKELEGRAPSPSQGPPKVHIMSGTPEWDAWTTFNGKAKPIDKTGGFYFPSRWPPISNAEEAA